MVEPAIFQRDFYAALNGRRDAQAFPAAGMAVHRNTGARAVQDALAANYPVVRQLFGGEAFDACAAAFVAARPPREPRLSHYGQSLSAFIRDYQPAEDCAWIADVAALERLWLEALFAADAEPADPQALASGIDAETRLPLHPATRFASFDVPAIAIWLAHDAGDDDALATIDWQPQAALVTRPYLDVRVTAIDRGALAFLTEIAIGQPVLDAAQTALDHDPEIDLPAMFAQLLGAGAFLSPLSPRSQ